MSFWTWIREQWTYAGIINAHRAGGSRNPKLDAGREIFYRSVYIEPLRDYASARYLDGFSLDSSATEFIKSRLAAKTTALPAGETAMIRAVLRDMKEDEAFHPDVYRKYRADMDQAAAKATAEAKAIFGPTGLPPTAARVLRSRA